jgi:hypothetical protein
MKHLTLLLLALLTINVSAQYKKKETTNIPGIVGLTGLGTGFIGERIVNQNFITSFGGYDPYMTGNKLDSYNRMLKQGDTMILSGVIVAGVGLVIQAYINNKRTRKACFTHY